MESSKSGCSRKSWRRLIKKLRRKRIRQKIAEQEEKERLVKESSPTFLSNLAKKLLLEEELLEIEENERKLRHQEWLKVEEEARRSFLEQQRQVQEQENERLKAQQRIQEEWENARRRKDEQKRLVEKKAELTKAKIDNFIENGGAIPEELLVLSQTNPGRDACPFFSKVAACRFGPACSRNHVVPGISKVILINGFYTHFTLYQTRSAEYDTDVGLEFEDSEMYRDFREFFEDVTTELERFGELSVVVVCRNGEPHLRGNLYAEYRTERSALIAYKNLNARWYAGKQLNVRFVRLAEWGAAICGDFRRGRCPKGAECNFLHTFRNPRGQLQPITRNEVTVQSSVRSWRWSESPERRSVDTKSRHSSSRERRSSTSRHRKRSRERSSTSRRERDRHRHSSGRTDNWSSDRENRKKKKMNRSPFDSRNRS